MANPFVTGLDLGQTSDPTAIAVLERSEHPDPADPESTVNHFAVRHLERFHLGTSYTVIAHRVAKMFADKPLAGSKLAVDATGVGKPVVDMFRAADINAHLIPVTITGGHKWSRDAGGYCVPKKDLVSVLQVLLQHRRLKVAETLAEAKILVKELGNFQIKVTAAANEVFGAWREGTHDDLVLAVACAAWVGERQRRGPWKAEWV